MKKKAVGTGNVSLTTPNHGYQWSFRVESVADCTRDRSDPELATRFQNIFVYQRGSSEMGSRSKSAGRASPVMKSMVRVSSPVSLANLRMCPIE